MCIPGEPVAFAASCKAAAAVPPVLRQAGCFDYVVKLPTPGAPARSTMLASKFRGHGLHLSPQQLESLAAKAEGFDPSDLQLLVDRALHAAMSRRLSAAALQRDSSQDNSARRTVEILEQDLEQALEGFTPSAFWTVQKAAGALGWNK